MNVEHVPAALALGNGQVLLRGAAVLDTCRLVRSAVRQVRQDGIGLPTRLAPLLTVLEQEARVVLAAMSATGPTDVRADAEVASSVPLDEQLTATEVAQMVGFTARHVRRIAGTLGGRRVGGRWVFTRAEVAAFVADRQEVAA